MKILFVVPKLPTDPQDDKHIRVQHHHAEGLTYDTCLINGSERFVYSTSRIERTPKYGKTILVHCKPVPVETGKRLKCADIPTVELLNYVKLYTAWPTAANYRQWTGVTKFDQRQLALRKENTLVHKGYVTQYDDQGVFFEGRVFLTKKGQHRLKQLEQQRA